MTAFWAGDRRSEPLCVVATEKAVAEAINRTRHGFEHRVPDDLDRGSCDDLVSIAQQDLVGIAFPWGGVTECCVDASEFEPVDDLGGD